jgi:hypothetical protein
MNRVDCLEKTKACDQRPGFAWRIRTHPMEEIDSQDEPKDSEESVESRRKGLDRRWIKSKYSGPERRAGRDRRARKEKPEKTFNPEDIL